MNFLEQANYSERLPFLVSISTASLANRSDLNRAVFSRITRASVSYCGLACPAFLAFCAFLNCALAASLELLANVGSFSVGGTAQYIMSARIADAPAPNAA